jgi:hypothetical protein
MDGAVGAGETLVGETGVGPTGLKDGFPIFRSDWLLGTPLVEPSEDSV